MNGSRKISNFFLILTLLAGLFGLTQPAQASAPLLADLWVTNGIVYATQLSGSILYIGGAFTYVGPPTGSFAALDAAGAPDRAFPPVDGTIQAIAPDGVGGWYVGGTFTYVGGHPRNNLAHLKADKSLDFDWNPNASSTVNALVVSGSTIYAGGAFTTIGGQTRNNIAALNASDGLATTWNPNASSTVNALAVSGSTVYAGGSFTSIGGQPRNRIAALNASDGLATTWNPNASSVVLALAVSGSTLYAGGQFITIGSAPVITRNRIAAWDISTGALSTTWDPNADGIVRALAVSDDGSTVYAGGDFITVNGTFHHRIAALNASTGLATTWNPTIANNSVFALAVSGSTVYAGGSFTSIGGQPRNRIAAWDISTGALSTWDPNAGNAVRALAVSGSTVYAGGSFTSIGGQTRNNIAALDTSTGSATAWNPNADANVNVLAVSGSTIYVGGAFTNIGGEARNRIAALNASDGLAILGWNPNAGNAVRALAVSGSTVYAGGDFTTIGGQPCNRIVALNASDGLAIQPWNSTANQSVRSLVVSGSTIYAGGDFSSIGGQSRSRIAALNASDGLATTWNPNANTTVNALVLSGNTLYAGGSFTTIGSLPAITRNRMAAWDISTGALSTWDPNADGIVYALAMSGTGSTVYAGGVFTTIGGLPRNRIAALNASDGLTTTWNSTANQSVRALAVSGSTIYAGGLFTSIAGRPNSYIAALRDGAATCQSAASGGTWQVSNWSGCGGAVPGDGDSLVLQNGHALTLYGSLAANDLTTNTGGALELPQGSTLTVEGTVTHNGRLTQTLAVPTTATTTFLNLKNAASTTDKFFGATLTPTTGDMGNTRVSIYGNQKCTGQPGDALLKRCFDITPTTSQNATLRLYYPNAELNSQIFNALKLWHWSSGWSQVGSSLDYTYSSTCNVGQLDCYIQAVNVSAYSPFGAGSGSQPTAVRLQSFAARSIPAEGGLVLFGLLLLGLGGVGIARRRARSL